MGCRRWVGGGGGVMMRQSRLEREKLDSVLKWVGVLSSLQQRGGLCKAAKVEGTPERSSG